MKQGRKRDPKAKRDAAHRAALALFAAQGFDAVSMADVARKAGVAVGTLYRLYPSKTALLAALHHDLESTFVDRMRRAWLEARGAERMDAVMSALFDMFEERAHELAILSMTTDVRFPDGSLSGDLIRRQIASFLREGMGDGTFRPGPARLHADLAHGMVEGAMRAFLRGTVGRETAEAEAKALLRRAFVL